MEGNYPVAHIRSDLQKRPEETLEEAAQTFRMVGQVAFAVAAIFGTLAFLARLLSPR